MRKNRSAPGASFLARRNCSIMGVSSPWAAGGRLGVRATMRSEREDIRYREWRSVTALRRRASCARPWPRNAAGGRHRRIASPVLDRFRIPAHLFIALIVGVGTSCASYSQRTREALADFQGGHFDSALKAYADAESI